MKLENTQSLASAEVAIVGAGPIGLEMAAALKGAGVDYLHLEARQIGYTITWWPRETHFFSTTERIEIAGIPLQNTSQQRATGEEYLAYLRSTSRSTFPTMPLIIRQPSTLPASHLMNGWQNTTSENMG